MAEKLVKLVCPKDGYTEMVPESKVKGFKHKKDGIIMLLPERAKAFAKVYAAANSRKRRRVAAGSLVKEDEAGQ